MKIFNRIPIRQVKHSRSVISCWPKPNYGPVEVQRSELLNGIKLAAVMPGGAPLGACTIMFQAGSRYENYRQNQLGVTHFLRAASSTSSCSYTGFAKLRVLQQVAASITCTSDRQSIAYTLRCPPFYFPTLQNYLLDTAVRSCYNEWEIDDLRPLIRDDNHRIHPEERVLDLAQQACFRGPLSQSIFCYPMLIDQIDGKMLKDYTKTHFKTDHCTVASYGIPFEDVIKMTEKIEMCRDKPPPRMPELNYPLAGFEYYDLGHGADTWICAVVPGCGTCDAICLLSHNIVAAACGTEYMQVGSHSMDHIDQTPLADFAGTDPYTQFRAFNISYQETGVFGILVKTRSCSAWNAAITAVKALAGLPRILTTSNIRIGKNRLKLNLALHDDECTKVTEGFALQLANNVIMDNVADTFTLIESIPNDVVWETAKGLSNKCCQMAIAVVGDVGAVPHDKELRL